MEDVVINGYTQVLLAGIGTSLIAAIGALWVILWKVIAEKDALHQRYNDKYETITDKYHAFAINMERIIERAIKG